MNNHGGSGNLMGKLKLESTYDISKMKKGSFHSQGKYHFQIVIYKGGIHLDELPR